MLFKKLQRIVLFSLLIGLSTPAQAFWGQETLSRWSDAVGSVASTVTSYVADVAVHPAEHKVAVAVGTVCTLGLAAAAVWAWRRWAAPADQVNTDQVNTNDRNDDNQDNNNDNTSSSLQLSDSGSSNSAISGASGSVLPGVLALGSAVALSHNLNNPEPSNEDADVHAERLRAEEAQRLIVEQAARDRALEAQRIEWVRLNKEKYEGISKGKAKKGRALEQKAREVAQQRIAEEATARAECERLEQVAQEKVRQEAERARIAHEQAMQAEQQRIADEAELAQCLAAQEQASRDAQADLFIQRIASAYKKVFGEDLSPHTLEIFLKNDDMLNELLGLNALPSSDDDRSPSPERLLQEEAEQRRADKVLRKQQQRIEKDERKSRLSAAINTQLLPEAISIITDTEPEQWPAWEEVCNKLKSEDLNLFLKFLLNRAAQNEQQEEFSAEQAAQIKDSSNSNDFMNFVGHIYEQVRSAHQLHLDNFQPVADEDSNLITQFIDKLSTELYVEEQSVQTVAAENALGQLKKGGIIRAVQGLFKMQYGIIELGVMGRRFVPSSNRPTSMKLVVSIHGTFANPDSFGGKEDHETTQALYAALQRLANKENAVIHLVVPRWTSEFNNDHRLAGAQFISSLVRTWHAKYKNNNCSIDVAAHSEGNSVVAELLTCLQDAPDTKKLITWMSMCPTAGSDCSHDGIKARLSYWSPADALALFASGTRGETFRKPDKGIENEGALVMNFCIRHNGSYVDHVTAKVPIYANYDKLFEIAQLYKGFCELSVDFADAHKEILVGIRPSHATLCRPDLADSKRADLCALSALHESRFKELHPGVNWHEKPHSPWDFVWKYVMHGISELGSAKANDRRKTAAALLPAKTPQDIAQMNADAQAKHGNTKIYGVIPSLREMCGNALAQQRENSAALVDDLSAMRSSSDPIVSSTAGLLQLQQRPGSR